MMTTGIVIALATAGADGQTKTTKRSPDKIVCKTETAVGTLIPGPRVCHTVAEWDAHAVAAQAIGRKLVDSSRGQGADLGQ